MDDDGPISQLDASLGPDPEPLDVAWGSRGRRFKSCQPDSVRVSAGHRPTGALFALLGMNARSSTPLLDTLTRAGLSCRRVPFGEHPGQRVRIATDVVVGRSFTAPQEVLEALRHTHFRSCAVVQLGITVLAPCRWQRDRAAWAAGAAQAGDSRSHLDTAVSMLPSRPASSSLGA